MSKGNSMTTAELETMVREQAATMPGRHGIKGDVKHESQPNAVLRGKGRTCRRRVAGTRKMMGEG